MLNELRKNDKLTKWEFQQRDLKNVKELNRNSAAEECNNWTKKFTREVQQETWTHRINQQAQRQIMWNYPKK